MTVMTGMLAVTDVTDRTRVDTQAGMTRRGRTEAKKLACRRPPAAGPPAAIAATGSAIILIFLN